MWLLYNSDIDSHTTLNENQSFKSLFTSQNVVDASGLIFPENVTNACYSHMFCRCSDLVAAPDLPMEVTVPEYGYYEMFSYCTSLVTPPEIAATGTSRYSLTNMFANCTNLQTIPEIYV